MLAAYIFIALFGSFMWLYYFKLIDVFQPEKWLHLMPSFLLGAASTQLVLWLSPLVNLLPVTFAEESLNVAFEAVVKIGLVEEFSKALAFLLSYFILRKSINESIDYLIHVCLCALGFSAAENVLYFMHHGSEIIDLRFILSTFGHIFDSSVFAYGLIYALYKAKGQKPLIILSFLLLAGVFHGIYDFLIMYEFAGNILLLFLYFLVTVSFFSVTLNNTLNHSEHFSYKKVIYPNTVFIRMLYCYGILLLLKTFLLTYEKDALYALKKTYSAMLLTMPMMMIVFQRISRFTLIKNHWMPFKIELPFTTATHYSENGLSSKLVIKGHGQQEAILGSYFGTTNTLCALSERNAWFDDSPEILLHKKLFLEGYSIFYRIKFTSVQTDTKSYFIKAKVGGSTLVSNQYPVVALLCSKKDGAKGNELNNFDDFEFLCWCYLKPETVQTD